MINEVFTTSDGGCSVRWSSPVTAIDAFRGAINEETVRVHCGNCRFWQTTGAFATRGETGSCRLGSPTVTRKIGETQWPTTHHEQWCGEGQPKQ